MPKWYISNSQIHGEGVFAKKDLKKGEIIFILKGPYKTHSILTKKELLTFPNWIGVDHLIWVDPELPADKINHSCEPNVGVRGQKLFCAMRNIKKNEELVFDYSITEESVWQMNCDCRTRHCRRVVGSIFSLPRNTFNKYLPFIPSYFQRVYNLRRKYSL
jgi:uncharacterized protein